MPEGPEVETERLHEAMHEELEKEGGAFLKRIALTTALLAALAAISALYAGATVNEALVLKTEATRLQAEASDQWAYYQAKGIKAAVAEASAATWQALGKTAPPQYATNQARYGQQQKDIEKAAREKEHERDVRSEEADHLLHRHHRFADTVALYQVAIALGAVAALTRNRLAWLASILLGVGGTVLLLVAFFG
jgi:Domain of unknown function (DUF4337)